MKSCSTTIYAWEKWVGALIPSWTSLSSLTRWMWPPTLCCHYITSYNNHHLSISTVISTIDAIAPPTVTSNYSGLVRQTLLRKKRRTRQKSFSGGDSEDRDNKGFFGNGNDGPSVVGDDPTFNFVYEFMYWMWAERKNARKKEEGYWWSRMLIYKVKRILFVTINLREW